MLSTLPYPVRFQAHLESIHAFLEDILIPQEPETLWAAMRHGVLGGGKRIRPVLLLECCRATGGDMEQALPTAAALELIHCYSLIHDDLPCMDDDDWRRGRPTVHKAFSEDIAVLAGDALVGMAFGLIVDRTQGVEPGTLLTLISELSAASSVKGLVNGQVEDILSAGKQPDKDLLYRIHAGKTAALFRFSCRAGAWLAGQPRNIVDQFGEYGERLGLTFQIVEDLLDIRAPGEVLGKTPGKDEAQGKITFPAVFGVEGAEAILEDEVSRLLALVDSFPGSFDTDNLRFLVQFVQERES